MLYQRGKAYSQDLRERVFAASDDGERVGEVAELLRVSVSYVSKALTRRRTTGETTVRAGRGHKPPKLAPFYAAIRAHVAERGDTTIEALRAWLLARHQVSASVGLIWHTLKLLGLTLKKSRCERPSRIGRTSPRPVRHGARASQRLIRPG
jgi:transposase